MVLFRSCFYYGINAETSALASGSRGYLMVNGQRMGRIGQELAKLEPPAFSGLRAFLLAVGRPGHVGAKWTHVEFRLNSRGVS